MTGLLFKLTPSFKSDRYANTAKAWHQMARHASDRPLAVEWLKGIARQPLRSSESNAIGSSGKHLAFRFNPGKNPHGSVPLALPIAWVLT
ncbi:MAG TPA: hypothetical protein PLB25_01625 [Rhodoferax sp.]|nr:hypothetical protein [Rhodoferax sp.]